MACSHLLSPHSRIFHRDLNILNFCNNLTSSEKRREKVVLEKTSHTAQRMKFFIRDFSSKSDQIHSFLQIWSHLLKKSLMENFTFCAAPFSDWERVNEMNRESFFKIELFCDCFCLHVLQNFWGSCYCSPFDSCQTPQYIQYFYWFNITWICIFAFYLFSLL